MSSMIFLSSFVVVDVVCCWYSSACGDRARRQVRHVALLLLMLAGMAGMARDRRRGVQRGRRTLMRRSISSTE